MIKQNQSIKLITSSVDDDPSLRSCSTLRRENNCPHSALGSRLFKLGAKARGPLLVAALAFVAARLPADVVIDNLEGTPISWSFFGDNGATGSVTSGAGHTGRGGVLSYDFSRSDAPVASAILDLSNRSPRLPVPAAISLWLKSPANISVRLRVYDSGNHTFQYILHRPFTATDPSAWYQQVVALKGGNDSGGSGPSGTVTRIDILGAEPIERGPRDAISFDDVVAISAVGYTLDPSVRAIPGPPQTGDLTTNMGVSIHLENIATLGTALNAAAAAGFAFVRTDLFWSDIEAGAVNGTYTWTKYDNLITQLEHTSPKLGALFILDFGNTRYNPGGDPPTSAAAVTAFGNYAAAAASHFRGKNVRYEIWNEPDGDKHPLNPVQYAAVVKEALRRIHGVDPLLKVTTAGTMGFNDLSYIRGYLNQHAGTGTGVNLADGIGVHPYDASNPGGDLVDKLVMLRSVLREFYATPPPVWQTEWGFSATDYSDDTPAGPEKRQALLAVRELLSSYAVGFPLFVYYDLRNDGSDGERENNFGLLTEQNADKPAMTAVRTLTRFTKGRTFTGFVPISPTSLAGMRFQGASNTVFVLWSSALQGVAIPITVPNGATVVNMLGGTVPLQNQKFNLLESDGPVYITTTP